MACITNGGYYDAAEKQASAIKEQAVTDTAIQVALALWQRNSSGSIANMQNEIANRNMRLAEAVHDHAMKFWPYEKAIVDDAFAENKAHPQYPGLSASWGALMDDTLRRGRTDWLEEMRQRCLKPTNCEAARWDRVAQQSRADIISFADRQAEARAETLNDLRFSRQLAALGLGKGILANVKSYQDLSGTVGANARGALIGTINSGLEALGYFTTRTQFEGWGQGIQRSFDRAPYEAPQPAPQVAVSMPVQMMPAVAAQPLQDHGPCGPYPADGDHEGWRRYDRCMGNK